MKRAVIGMTAHVDSGKTTLVEAMLYKSGNLRKIGRVDHGDAFLDTHNIEKSRGITVFSKQAVMKYGEAELTLLDTPGHIDFSAETERAYSVLDMAVLVISGTDGVQSHTETLWRLLSRYNIPVFIFVNKMDISSYDREYILKELKSNLSEKVTDFSDKPVMDDLALCSETLMEEYLETGDISNPTIRDEIFCRNIYPCFFGSALKLSGVEELISAIECYCPEIRTEGDFGARIYKITEENGTRLTHLKITGGSLKVRGMITCGRDNTEEKINQIRVYSGAKFSTVEEATQGMLCAVTGPQTTYSGEGLGFERDSFRPVLEPVLSYRVILPDNIDIHTAVGQLKRLQEEDPQLNVSYNSQLDEIQVSLMGEIQLEILKTLISERFGYDVEFDRGSITYKETISGRVEGVGHYEPLRHYAEVHLLMEAGERGSGLVFETDCSEDILDRNWQRLILTHLREKTHLGVLTGSPITDMKITVKGGRAHLKHTEGGDFRQATYRAVRMGLRHAESVLLEPWYSFRLELPSENLGRALNDLGMMEAELEPHETMAEKCIIKGIAPVSSMMGYHTDVAGYTKGRGKLICTLSGYYPCKNAERVISEIGYNPDSDLDNTADSVFCSHGAGFAVKWDEVTKYMHVESCLKEKKEPSEHTPSPISRSMAMGSYDDKELTAIFERTYGKIKRDTRNLMHTEKEKRSEGKYKSVNIPKGPEYLLVDGYNIIFAWDELKKLAEENLELARNTLINILCNYQGYRKCRLILVFDAYKVKGNKGDIEKIGGITVVYTKEAETADMYIEKTSHELGKEYRVRVATSDRLEQLIILGGGAYRVSASEFYAEVKETEAIIRDIISKNESSNILSGGNNMTKK